MSSPNGPLDESEHAGPTSFDTRILDILLSAEFRTHFNEFPKGDERRAIALLRAGGQFDLHFSRTGSLVSLDHAIAFTAEALEELPKTHDELPKFITVYAHRLQMKAEKTHDPEDDARYVSVLEKKVEFIQGILKQEATRELGCAYFSRFAQTKNYEYLEQAITVLQEFFETFEKIHFQSAIYLGAVLYHRYNVTKQSDDLINAVELLQKGLEFLPQGKAGIQDLQNFGAGTLVSASTTLNNELPDGDILERMIKSIESILASLSPGSVEAGRLTKQHIHAIMRRFFKGPESA